MSGTPTLEVEGLTKVFQGRPVLSRVSFSLRGPRTVGYLGPNGAGKTTTLKLLTGLLRASEGSARIDGIDVARNPKRALAGVGAVIETPEPYPELTVREALRMAGRFRGLSEETIADRTRHFDEKLELPPLDRRSGRLSKGQRQRAVLAAALLAEPPILILDEPTSGLDPAERVRVRNLLLELKPRCLILMSSHLLGEVTETCDDVIFLNRGQLVRRGSVPEITDALVVRQVEVEFAHSVAPEALSPLRAVTEAAVQIGPRRFRLTFDGTVEHRIALLERCQSIAPVIEYAATGSALEGVYMELMGESAGSAGPPRAG